MNTLYPPPEQAVTDSIPEKKQRLILLDELRGFAVCCMVFYHGFYSMASIFGLSIGRDLLYFFMPAEPWFAGLFILFFPQWAQRCLPWGYYGVLLQAEMLWDPVTRNVSYAWLHTAPSDYGLLALWLLVLFAFSYRVFVRKEV